MSLLYLSYISDQTDIGKHDTRETNIERARINDSICSLFSAEEQAIVSTIIFSTYNRHISVFFIER